MKDSDPRIAFVATTMSEFDAVLDVQEVRRNDQYLPLIAALLERLRRSAQVIDFGITGNDAEASAKGAQIARSDCDLLLVWPLNYTLDTVILHLTKGSRLPLLLLNSAPLSVLPKALDFGVIMENNAVACIPTFTNVLLKNHVDFTVISGALADASLHNQITLYAKAAGVARALRQSRIGVVGHTYPGISSLSVDQAAVTGQFGVELVQIAVQEIAKEYAAVPDEEVHALAEKVRSAHEISDIKPEEIRDSVRFEPALRRLVAKYRLNAVASLCQELILHDKMGITPCHGHSALAEMGVVVTCECDVATAVVMLILRQFTDEVLFQEYYAQDYDRGIGMLSHCGQGDRRMAGGAVSVKPHPCFSGHRGRGISYEYLTKTGDATMACLTCFDGRWRMVAARIECVAHEKVPSSTAQLYFKFKDQDFNAAYHRWCEIGGIHHFGVGFGDHWEGLKTACRYLGVQFCGVQPAWRES